MKLGLWFKAGYSLLLGGLILVAGGCHGPTAGPPAANSGPGWKQATAAAAFGAIYAHSSLVFKGQMWVIGGSGGSYKNDVWSSADGVGWTEATKGTDSTKRFSARYAHTSLVFKDPADGKDKMWVIGGYSDNSYKNDVWSSGDGKDWTWVNKDVTEDSKRFPARSGHSNLVFKDPADGKDKMWVIGGIQIPAKSDVYASIDGLTWSKVTDTASWSARSYHNSLVFKDKMWVLGGNDGSSKKDVWWSSNGKDWQQAPAAAWLTRYYHSSLVFTDPADSIAKMVVMGGTGIASNVYNDVWWSVDGQSWTQDRLADWSPRDSHSSVVFKDKIWVLGGGKSDVWYYDRPAFVPAVSPADSTTPTAANPASP